MEWVCGNSHLSHFPNANFVFTLNGMLRILVCVQSRICSVAVKYLFQEATYLKVKTNKKCIIVLLTVAFGCGRFFRNLACLLKLVWLSLNCSAKSFAVGVGERKGDFIRGETINVTLCIIFAHSFYSTSLETWRSLFSARGKFSSLRNVTLKRTTAAFASTVSAYLHLSKAISLHYCYLAWAQYEQWSWEVDNFDLFSSVNLFVSTRLVVISK